MYIKDVKYKDFAGNEQIDKVYCNYLESELIDIDFEKMGMIWASNDQIEFVRFMKNFILDAYGIKSLDNKRFIKNEEQKLQFSQSQAFSTLLIMIVSDEKEAQEFIKNVLPQEFYQKLLRIAEDNGKEVKSSAN